MTDGEWITVSAALLSLAYTFVGLVRSGRGDTIEFLKGKVADLEQSHTECESQLAALRGEVAWMRANMVLKMPGIAGAEPTGH